MNYLVLERVKCVNCKNGFVSVGPMEAQLIKPCQTCRGSSFVYPHVDMEEALMNLIKQRFGELPGETNESN